VVAASRARVEISARADGAVHFELTNHHISSYDRGASVTADDKHFKTLHILTSRLEVLGGVL